MARKAAPRLQPAFDTVVADITDIGRRHHEAALTLNAERNAPLAEKTLADIPRPRGAKARRAVVVSAGPSLHRFDVLRRIRESGFDGSIVCIDGSLVKCLKNGVQPDYMVTLDPHPTRVVRWFGDRHGGVGLRHDHPLHP